jgi:hypothetical protein
MFLAHLAKGNVSFCHHLAGLVDFHGLLARLACGLKSFS